MRKKLCLKTEPCEPPIHKQIKNKRSWDRGIPYITTIAKAQVVYCGDDADAILNIDMYHDGRLKARYFADKEARSHRVLIIETGDWKQLCLQNVANVCAGLDPDYSEYKWGCSMERWDYETAEDLECVHKYLEQDVIYWEQEIQRNKRYQQLNNKQIRINAMMAEVVPDIPGDFYRWVHEDVFGRRYLFQKKLKKMIRIKCTACGKSWVQKKGIGIGRRICPKCGKEVIGTYKQEEKGAEKSIYLLQPCRVFGRWVERYFRASCVYTPENTSTVSLDERIRVIVPNGKSWGYCYYEDCVDSQGNPLYWDANHFNGRMTDGYLYPGNLQKLRKCWPETLVYSGIDILAAKNIKFNVNHMITDWHKKPGMEYLIKGGFYRLASEIIRGRYWSNNDVVDIEGSSPQEALGVSPDRINRFRQMDGGYKILGWLQYEQITGKKMSQANLIEMDKHGIDCTESDIEKLLAYVKSPDAFANYLRKQSKLHNQSRRQVINDWLDYLDMAKKQKLNLSHEMFYKPKDLKAAHDACVRNAQKEELQKKAKGILQKFPDVETIMDAIREKYTYDGEEYSIIVPADVADIIHEGRALGHCIDTTDRYFDRIQNHITYLVFLRKRESKDVPYYTLEIEPGGTIRQQRTTGNNQNKKDVKDYAPFIQEWQREVRKRISEEDRHLAEISRETRIREYQELRDKQEKVWRGALAGKLLVDVLEADLIEAI